MTKAENFSFDAKISKLLKLMVHSIYTNKDIFLRELISNSIDAIEKRKYLSLQNGDFAILGGDYKVQIAIDPKKHLLTIRDNGVGMSRDDLIANLGTIAQSGTEDFVKQMAQGSNSSDLIGQFGVGFYSVFMVAKKVEVKSRKLGETVIHKWISEGEEGYSLKEIDEDFDYGTEILIHLDTEHKEKFVDKYHIEHIIKTYSGNVGVPIELNDGEEASKFENMTTGSALWNQDKKSVTEEQYQEFYKSVAHLPDKPAITIHYRAEGKVEYNALLFVPSMKPFDLFHPDRQTRVKLYVRKVFICEQGLDIIPRYLRFVYGVIDSSDLPLNISRETLQDSHILHKITEGITKKIINELKNLAKNADEYEKLWKNFGSVIKEGLCEQHSDRENLLHISRFYSTKNPDKLTSLDDYIASMPEKQKEIYYCTGESVEEIMQNPQMEMFIKNGIEVICLTDTVDGFWINVANDYLGKDFKSITRADLDIDNLNADKPAEDVNLDEENELNGKLKKYFKVALEENVKEIRISHKLTDSPASIGIDAGAMDIKMERFLMEQNQIAKSSLKILELNPKNHLVLSVLEKMQNFDETVANQGKELALTIFEIACIAQGEPIKHPALFAKRVAKLLDK